MNREHQEHLSIAFTADGLVANGPPEDVLEALASWLEWKHGESARPCPVVVRLGPLVHKTTIPGGSDMENQTIALNLPDDCYVEVEVGLPLLDNGGNPLQNEDGTPYTPDLVLESSDPEVALVQQVPGNAGKIYGQKIGQATITITVSMPDGTAQVIDILTSVLPSEAGAVGVKFGQPIHGEPGA